MQYFLHRIILYAMFQGLVTTLKCLAGCLTYWPHQSLPLSSDNPPCCRSEVPGSSGDQARAAKVRSSILSLPCLVLLPEAWGGLEKVGQSAYLPWCLDGKEPACNAGDLASIPGLGRSPGERNGNPLSILACKIPWTEEPGRMQSMGSQRIKPD